MRGNRSTSGDVSFERSQASEYLEGLQDQSAKCMRNVPNGYIRFGWKAGILRPQQSSLISTSHGRMWLRHGRDGHQGTAAHPVDRVSPQRRDVRRGSDRRGLRKLNRAYRRWPGHACRRLCLRHCTCGHRTSDTFKAGAATLSGLLLLLLGVGVLLDVGRRFVSGEPPEGAWMVAVAAVALGVNATVLRLLSKQRQDEVHMRATWIFTRADVVANVAVIASGIAVLMTGIRYFDLIVGAAIGLYVAKEALEILSEARKARLAA